MSTFERKYSDDQKEAAVHAYLDLGIKPQHEVRRLAAEGLLKTRDGRTVPPCTIPKATFPQWITDERKRRYGKKKGAAMERPDDVLENLRRRMIAVAEAELSYAEKTKAGKRDTERIRQIARLVREVAALPGPKEGRPVAPGQRQPATHNDGHTGGGIAGQLLAAHRTRPAPDALTEQETRAENTDASAHARSEQATEDTETMLPGSIKRDPVRERGLTHTAVG
jgi:hypothetical protein